MMAALTIVFDIGDAAEAMSELCVLWGDGRGLPAHLRDRTRRMIATVEQGAGTQVEGAAVEGGGALFDIDMARRRVRAGHELIAILANLRALRASP